MTLGSFGVTLGALLAYLGAFGTSSEPFRRHFRYMKVRLRKCSFFQQILMTLEKYQITSGHFGATLGSFRVTLEPLLAYEGDFWAYLKYL